MPDDDRKLEDEFDHLARRFGYEEATSLRAKEKRVLMTRMAGRTMNARQFRDSVFHALQSAQRKVERASAGRLRHAAKCLAKKREKDVLASLGKPVSRDAGRAEHLAVLAALPHDLFFRTKEWRRTRWEALNLYGRVCCSCGATPADESRLVATHVDSRLLRPDRAFALANIRILCTDCHIGRRALAGPTR